MRGSRRTALTDGDAALLQQLHQKPQRVLTRHRRNVERLSRVMPSSREIESGTGDRLPA